MKKTYIAPSSESINLFIEQALLNNSIGVSNDKRLDAGSSYSGGKDYSSQIWGTDED